MIMVEFAPKAIEVYKIGHKNAKKRPLLQACKSE